jgi:hypothetical protein
LHGDEEDDEQQKPNRANPRDLLTGFSPEATRRDPKPFQQVTFARPLDFFRRHCFVGLGDLSGRRFDPGRFGTIGSGGSDALPPAFFGAPSSGLPDTLLDFLAVADFVFLADDFVSEPASDDCASESLPFDFLADDFALPIT